MAHSWKNGHEQWPISGKWPREMAHFHKWPRRMAMENGLFRSAGSFCDGLGWTHRTDPSQHGRGLLAQVRSRTLARCLGTTPNDLLSTSARWTMATSALHPSASGGWPERTFVGFDPVAGHDPERTYLLDRICDLLHSINHRLNSFIELPSLFD